MRIMVKKDGDNVNIRPHINSIKENLKSKQAKKESKKESKTPKGSSSKKKKSLKPKKFGPHAPLSGGRWITVTDESSPLHGRHLYINSSGTILAGAVPQSMHGQKLGDLHKPHKGHKGVHNDLSDMNEKQLESIKEQANGLHGKLGEDHVVGQSAKILHDIADHYHMKAQAKAGIPHPKEKELHAKMKEMSPKELHSMAHDLDASEAEHDISKHYLTQKMMTDAPHPHMEWTHEDAQGMSVDQLKQEFDDNMKNITDPDFEDEASQTYIKNANAIYNHYLTKLHGEKPYWGKVPHYGEAKYDGTIQSLKKKSLAELHEYQQELFKHYQNGQASDEHAKNLNEIANHFLRAKGGDASPLPKKKPTSPVHTEDLPGANKTLAGADKSDLAVWMSLQDKLINGGSHISPAIKEKAQKKKEVAEFYLDHLNATGKTWAESNAPKEEKNITHENAIDPTSVPGEAYVAGKLKGGHGVDNGDGTVNFTFNGTHNGSSGTHTVTMPKEKFSAHADVTGAMDAFNHGKVAVQTTDHELHGKNVADYGVDHNDPKHVTWNVQIDHDAKGKSATQIKSEAESLTKQMYNGDNWYPGEEGAKKAKIQNMNNLAEKLQHNPKFISAVIKICQHEHMDFQLGFEPHNIKKGDEKAIAQAGVRQLLGQWARSSGETYPLSVAMQLIAKDTFGLDKAFDGFHAGTVEKAKDRYMSDPDVKEGLASFLKEQYNQTQNWFKERGITHIPVVRGMSFHTKDPIDHIPMNTPVKTKMSLQPLSSFSSESSTAQTFTGTVTGGGGKYKIYTAAYIPIERVLGHVQTGYGCMGEQEFIVLGGKEKLDNMITVAFQGSGFSHNDIWQLMSNPKFSAGSSSASGSDSSPKLDVTTPSNKTIAQTAISHAKKIVDSAHKSYGEYNYDSHAAEQASEHYGKAISDIMSAKDFQTKAKAHLKAQGEYGITKYEDLSHEHAKSAADDFLHEHIDKLGKQGYKPGDKVETATLKKPTKDYHIATMHGSKPAENAKHVVNHHGLDLFVHKVGGAYKVSEGSTGKAVTGSYTTQKKAVEAVHNYLEIPSNVAGLKEHIDNAPKLTHHMTKSYKEVDGVLHADAEAHNANWTKQSLDVDADVPKIGSPEYKKFLASHGMTEEQFKQTTLYKLAMQKQMKKGAEKGYYPSQRHAYKTNHKDPIYLPLNRLKTPYQTGKALDQDKIKENIAKINAGQSLAPVVIGYDYDLHDGHHRLEAAKACGHSHVPCVVGGRNERRTKAADKRYRSVYKSLVKEGRLLVKKVADEDIDIITDHKWITVRGSRVLIHKETGKVVSDHPTLKGKTLVMKDKKEEVKKSMTKSFIDTVGRLLFRK